MMSMRPEILAAYADMDDLELARKLQEEEDALDRAYFERKRESEQNKVALEAIPSDVFKSAIVGFFVNTIPHFGGLAELPNRFSVNFAQLFAGPQPPSHIVLFNYMVDPVWLVNAIPNFRAIGKVSIIMDWRMKSMFSELQNRNPLSTHRNCRVYYPRMSTRFSCHHTKLFLIYFETGVRVVITTANLLDYDWYNKNQGVWVQDFPLTDPDEVKNESGVRGTFGHDLVAYVQTTVQAIEGVGNREEIADLKRLRRHDFRAALARLIYSTPCTAQPASRNTTGVGIHRVVQLTDIVHSHIAERCNSEIRFQENTSESKSESPAKAISPSSTSLSYDAKPKSNPVQNTLYGFVTSKKAQREAKDENAREPNEGEKNFLDKAIIVQCSSLGSPGVNFFSILMSAFASGADASDMKLVWPSVNNVRNSIEGYEGGDSLPLSQKNCLKFMEKHSFWKWNGDESSRGSALPHIKSYARCYKTQRLDNMPFAAKLAWACLTSANATQAAWGRTSRLSGPAAIIHFEMGVWFDEALWLDLLEKVLLDQIPQELFWFSCTTPLDASQVARALKDSSRHDQEFTPSISSNGNVLSELGQKREREEKLHCQGRIGSVDKKEATIEGTHELIRRALQNVQVDLIQPKASSAFERIYCGPVFKTSAKEIIDDHPFISMVRSIRSWIKRMHSQTSESSLTAVQLPSWNLQVILPLPYSLQPEPYDKSDIPWSIDVPHLEPDRYGKQHGVSH